MPVVGRPVTAGQACAATGASRPTGAFLKRSATWPGHYDWLASACRTAGQAEAACWAVRSYQEAPVT
jgi:hypothetical protein